MQSMLLSLFAQVSGPRRGQGKVYPLPPILLFIVLAMLAGAVSYRQVHAFISFVSVAGTATRYSEVVFRPFATADDVLPYSAVWLPGNDNPAFRRFLSLARSMSSRQPAPVATETAS